MWQPRHGQWVRVKLKSPREIPFAQVASDGSFVGIYQRASLGTSFKFELKERGYPKEFIDTLTAQLLLSMSGK